MDGLEVIERLRLEAPGPIGIGNPTGAEVVLLANGVVCVTTDSGNGIAFTPREITTMMPLLMASMLGGDL